jgi:fatty acid/phospholipid biosynthesis enzyme
MGGDYAPGSTIRGSILAREALPDQIESETGSHLDVLYQYGTIGTIYSKLVHEIAEPKVALLNMEQEEEKGNMATRSAYQIMKDSLDFDFIGNFE